MNILKKFTENGSAYTKYVYVGILGNIRVNTIL